MAIDAAWIGIIGTLAGTVAGAVAAHFQSKSQFTREKESQKRDMIRGKLEEAHKAIEEVKLAFMSCTGNAMTRVASGQVSEEKPLHFAKAKMLIGFYAPELKSSLAQLEAEWIKHNQAMIKTFKPSEARQGLTEMTQVTANIGEICSKMQDELAIISRNY